jgi:hypothetical protein
VAKTDEGAYEIVEPFFAEWITGTIAAPS